jgi:hypothetical protein
VPSAGIGINADLSFGAFALTLAKAITFSPVAPASMTSYSNALYTSSTDNNLYFRNSTGTNVQVTSGSTLNISIVGGIGGDYASVSALFSYEDSTRRYLAQQQGSPRPWAGFATADIDLYQKAISISNKVTLKSPNALAASYNVIFPAAAAAGNASVLTIDSTGQMRNDGVLGTNINLQLQGTGYIKQGSHSRQVQLRPQTAHVNGGSVTVNGLKPGGQVQASTIAKFEMHEIEDTEQLQSVHIKNQCVGTGPTTLTLYIGSDTGLNYGAVGGASATVAAGAAGYTTLTPSSPSVLGEGSCYWLEVSTRQRRRST